MHFPIPTIITTTTTTINTLLAATLLPLLATGQQLGANETICQFLYGTDYRDAYCHTVISRGVNAPCTDIEYVRNLTECSIRYYPTGWAVCVEKQSFLYPESGPLFGHGPSGMIVADMDLDDLVYVQEHYFRSNAMAETKAAGRR